MLRSEHGKRGRSEEKGQRDNHLSPKLVSGHALRQAGPKLVEQPLDAR